MTAAAEGEWEWEASGHVANEVAGGQCDEILGGGSGRSTATRRGGGRGASGRLSSAAPASVTKGMKRPTKWVGRGVGEDDKPVDAAPVGALATVVVVTSSYRG